MFLQLLEHSTPTGLPVYCVVTGLFAHKASCVYPCQWQLLLSLSCVMQVYVDPFWRLMMDYAANRYQLLLLQRVVSGGLTFSDGLWEIARAANADQSDDYLVGTAYMAISHEAY